MNHIKNMNHIKFPSIEQFNNVKRAVQNKAQFQGLDETGEPVYDRIAVLPTIQYEGTVKLHGTNAAIHFKDNEIVCQSRERLLTLDNDNAGFARYVSNLPSSVIDMFKDYFSSYNEFVIYGEWAGPTIQQNVGINKISKKSFFIFNAISVAHEQEFQLEVYDLPITPEHNELGIYNIYNFPTFELSIDFEHPEYAIDKINKWVLEVEAECPVAKQLGFSGIGEGLVLKPIDKDYTDPKFWFKAKGSEHSKSHVKKLATVNIAKIENINEFVAKVVDEERLMQGWNYLKDNNLELSTKSTGDFLRFIVNDVIKEHTLEMEENGIDPKEIGKYTQLPARRWFFEKISKL